MASVERGMVNQTRAVGKTRLIKKLGHLSEELMDRVNQALKLHYDVEQPPRY
jgi:mRNA-degrading endonuclease toxin of MazEF toxin-antitoxin module